MRAHPLFPAILALLGVAAPAIGSAGLEVSPEAVAAERINSTARIGEGRWAAGVRAPGVKNGEKRQELTLWRVADGQVRPQAAPGGQRALLRSEPVLLARGGELAGLAWLEGDRSDRLMVRWASFSNGRWSATEQVTSRGPGSQMALSGAVLDDGSLLLAWAAFDGTDDEIYFATSRGTGLWSEPRRLHGDNRVPDITPALLAVDGGALALWSAFDGEQYRLFSARFDGDRWSAAQPAGPPGSLYPTVDADSRLVVYRSTSPRGWGTFAVNPAGRMQNRAVVATPQLARPQIEADADGALRWRFADGSTTAVRYEVLPR
ncbi:MAG: hypothetical protein AAF481_02650 [Acidobacteriota bacterium]